MTSPRDTENPAHDQPGLGEQDLQGFLGAVTSIVGEENVSRDPSTGAPEGIDNSKSYGDPFPVGKPHNPGPAVRPETVDQVRDIVLAANEYRVPLWVVSRGKNLGYGGSAPVVDGTVILDLHKMDKIIEINEEYAYAIVEPGVTFQQLYDEIQRRKLDLWLSVPALGWGSVIGNTLERGIGYTPDAVHYRQQCGMEVVLPNGDLLRTGMGAVEDSNMWPLYAGGFGPGLDGLFFQSNYGIVTKMGIHMSPAPEAYTVIVVDAPLESDLAPLVGTMTDLMRRRIFTNPPQLFNRTMMIFDALRTDPSVIPMLGPHAAFAHHIPDSVLDPIAAHLSLPEWRATFALYAPPEAHPGLIQAVRRHFAAALPTATITTTTTTAPPPSPSSSNSQAQEKTKPPSILGTSVPPTFLPQNGVPSNTLAAAFSSLPPHPLHHNCYSPVLPPSGRELLEWYLGARRITAEHDLTFTADFHVFDRYVISINLVMYHPSAAGRMAELQRALMEYSRGLEGRYCEYRTHVDFMDETAKGLDFNGGAWGRFTGLLKDAVDPRGVIAVGKSGIFGGRGGKP